MLLRSILRGINRMTSFYVTWFVLTAGTNTIGDVFPAWAFTLILGVALAVAVYFTSEHYEKPKYHWVSSASG